MFFQHVTVALWGQTTLMNVTDMAAYVLASLMRLVALAISVDQTILTSPQVKITKVKKLNTVHVVRINPRLIHMCSLGKH